SDSTVVQATGRYLTASCAKSARAGRFARRRLYALHGHHCPFQCREALWLHQVRGDKRDLQQGCLRLGPRDRRPVPDRGRRELPRRAEPARPSPGAGGRPRGPARGVLLRGGGAAARRGAQRGRKGAA
ncbi:unnamed protein product, partial [Prorocentrum cordatum]